MSDRSDKDLIRPYVADGIEEYDNPMPRWWIGLFYLCIVFAAVYLAQYHLLGAPGLEATYLAEQKAAQESAAKAQAGEAQASTAKPLAARLADPAAVAEGKVVFETNCAPCHGKAGEGVIGPNLTDEYWLHGGRDEDVVKTVTTGVPEKGMIAWQPILGDRKIEQVVAYVLTLQGTNPPNPKAPQGEKYARTKTTP